MINYFLNNLYEKVSLSDLKLDKHYYNKILKLFLFFIIINFLLKQIIYPSLYFNLYLLFKVLFVIYILFIFKKMIEIDYQLGNKDKYTDAEVNVFWKGITLLSFIFLGFTIIMNFYHFFVIIYKNFIVNNNYNYYYLINQICDISLFLISLYLILVASCFKNYKNFKNYYNFNNFLNLFPIYIIEGE